MFLDLNKLNVSDIKINEELSFSEEELNNSAIKKLDNVKVVGNISLSDYEEIIINLNITGNMFLEDAVTLELINNPFNIEISESATIDDEYFCVQNNKMNLKEFVWKNIVLEVPIKITKKENENKVLEGNGWCLNKEIEETNAFSDLTKLFENNEK